MKDWKLAVAAKTAELISQGILPNIAARRARKACRHLHPAHKTALTRRLHLADARFKATGEINSYDRI